MYSRAVRSGLLPALVVGVVLAAALISPSRPSTGPLVCYGYGYGCGAPIVTKLWPFAGPITGGTTIDISGSNFNNNAPGTQPIVKFGTTPATSVTLMSDSWIRVVSPAHAAGVADVRVTTAAGTNTAGQALYRYVSASWCAIFELSKMPTTWIQNQTKSFTIVAFNCGLKTWPATGYYRVDSNVHFTTKRGPGFQNQAFWLGQNYHNLSKNIASNRGALIRITLTPRFHGTVYLEAEMIKLHQFWFSRYLSRPPQFMSRLVVVTSH